MSKKTEVTKKSSAPDKRRGARNAPTTPRVEEETFDHIRAQNKASTYESE